MDNHSRDDNSREDKLIKGFAPISGPQPKILILGTMPSVKSLDDQFYYAHPRNAFWPIIAHLSQRALHSKTEKISALHALQILLWDVLASCQRQGSLDSAIETPKANDFARLFQQNPQLEVVAFNGQAAQKLFQKHVQSTQSLPTEINTVLLPSTSPANARLNIADKILIWEEKLHPFL